MSTDLRDEALAGCHKQGRCLVPDDGAQLLVDGHVLSPAEVIWYLDHNEVVDDPPTTCGTPGCVLHQGTDEAPQWERLTREANGMTLAQLFRSAKAGGRKLIAAVSQYN